MIRGHFASKSIGFLTVVTYSASGPRDGKWALVPEPIFPNLEPPQILTEISHILFMTFANSGPQCLPAHFPQSGAPPNPYWNITHSLLTFANSGPQCLSTHFPQFGPPPHPYWNIIHPLYDIRLFWAPRRTGPFSSIWASLQILWIYCLSGVDFWHDRFKNAFWFCN